MSEFGPTGQFDSGRPLRRGDRGGLNAKISVLKNQRLIVVDFGTDVSFLLNLPDEASALAGELRSLVNRNFGALPYDASELPVCVTPDTKRRFVQSILPKRVQLLAANPEVFLAWADWLDAAALALKRTADTALSPDAALERTP
jgi:hypothetical protein